MAISRKLDPARVSWQLALAVLFARSRWRTAAAAVFLLLSVAAAHYVGHMLNLPPGIREAAFPQFVGTVSATVSLYLLAAALFARVLVLVVFSTLLALFAFGQSVAFGTGLHTGRKVIRLRRWLDDAVSPATLGLALVLFARMYLGTDRAVAGLQLVVVLGVFLYLLKLDAALLRLNAVAVFFLRSREEAKFKLALSLFTAFAVVAVVAAYIAGHLRFFHAAAARVVDVTTPCFSGPATPMLAAGGTLLLYHPNEPKSAFILVGEGFAVSSTRSTYSAGKFGCTQDAAR